MNNYQDINFFSQKIDFIDVIGNIKFPKLEENTFLNVFSSEKHMPFFWITDNEEELKDNYFINEDIFYEESNNSTPNILKSEFTSTDKFKKKYKAKFLSVINSTIFESGEDNDATILMSNLLAINHDATLTLLQDYFISALEDELLNESLMVKILIMLGDYSYESLYPYSQAMAMVAYNVKSIRVISAVFNLFGHWGNKASLNMLLKFNAPKEPWLLIKYNSLIKSLEERCSMLEK
jgi:hypothetical protein